jgi:hypothetical protein
MTQDIKSGQAEYYGRLFEKHGPGVDAVASAKQVFKDLRYEKLAAPIAADDNASVHEIGFGLAHFYEFLKQYYPTKKLTYSGSEVTPHFVDFCKKEYPGSEFFLRDIAERVPEDRYDYVIFAGTFYHLAGATPEAFSIYSRQMLKNAFAMTRKALVVNFITSYVEYTKEDLFHCDVGGMIDFTVKNLSRFFSIDHAYPLFEYTLIIYREPAVAARFPQTEFSKYFKSTKP